MVLCRINPMAQATETASGGQERKAIIRATTLCAWLIAIASAGLTLYVAYCMYTHFKMRVNDYGIYTNFIWNSAHGEPFRYLAEQSYLGVHLSFTLLLIAPLFWIWDHPFLLTLVQWLCAVAGAMLVRRIARRHGFPPVLTAAFAMLFMAYPYMQSVLLCDFHGVCVYFVLLPWLYHCLAFRREMVWLPLLLILGLREDAAFVAVPMILYFAVAERWKGGYVYAGIALAYAALACLALFPLLNGTTMRQIPKRGSHLHMATVMESFSARSLVHRVEAVFWLFLPATLLFRRGWAPVVVFPSLGLLIVQLSPEARVQALNVHYPAAVFSCLVLGMIEAVRRHDVPGSPGRGSNGLLLAVFLIAVTVIAYAGMGRLPGGRSTNPRKMLLTVSQHGLQALWVAQHEIPKQGLLLTDTDLVGFCANRADVLVRQRYGGPWETAHAVFLTLKEFADAGAKAKALLDSGKYGVTYWDGTFMVLQRGASPLRNREILK